MANTVIALKKSGTPSSVPTNLANGELAINYADGKLYYKAANGTIASISGNEPNYFGTVNANNTLVVADTPGDIFTLAAGKNIDIVGDAINDKITVGLTNDVTVPGLLSVTASSGDEGGEIRLANAVTNSLLAGPINIDIYQNKLRFFVSGGDARGAFINLAATSAGVGTDLLASSGSTDTYARATAGQAFDKANAALPNVSGASFNGNLTVSQNLTSDRVVTLNNGNGENFKVGDDAWIGDFNTTNSIRIKGQQNPADGYINFGNGDTKLLGRSGTGPLTYDGSTIWHAGNDGASSGLDADLLDGQHGSYYGLATNEAAIFLKANTANITADRAWNHANAAFANANTVMVSAQAAFTVANSSFLHGNAAYAFANSISLVANAAFLHANAAFANGNTVIQTAQSAFTQANLTFIHANNAFASANAGQASGNAGQSTANAAYAFANSAHSIANLTFTHANNAYSKANTANITADLAYTQANAAAEIANTKLSISGGTITGNLSIIGGLTVAGNTYRIDANTIIVNDPLIYLAGNNYVSDIVDIGFVANYNNGACSTVHTGFFRDATTKEYYVFEGYDKEPNPNHIDTAGNNFTISMLNASLRTSNLVLGGANAILTIGASFNHSNAAHASANAAMAIGNAAFAAANAAQATANQAFNKANTANITADRAWNHANAAFISANIAFANANTVMISAQAAFTVANSGFLHANAAFATVNSAFGKANNALPNTSGVSFNGNLTVPGTFSVGANLIVGNATPNVGAKLQVYNTSGNSELWITADNGYDPTLRFTGEAGEITNEGFTIRYDNSVGDTYFENKFGSVGAYHFLTSVVEALTINTDGKVGVGTTSPQYILDVKGEANVSSALIVNDMNVKPTIEAAFNKANTANITADRAWNHANAAFATVNSAFNVANTALPNTSGTVYNGQLSIPTLLVGSTAVDTARLRMLESGNISYIQSGTNASGSGRPIYFAKYATATTTMVLDIANSNVGIGRTDPLVKLDIVGTANASNLLVNGNMVFTAANDGSGSNLDADLLDGQHGSYYGIATDVTAANRVANAAFLHANASYAFANSIATTANLAFTHANNAYAKANSITGGAYYSGNNGDVGNASGLGDIFRVHTNTLTANVTIYSGNNALAAGPITVASGKVLTIQANARVSIV